MQKLKISATIYNSNNKKISLTVTRPLQRKGHYLSMQSGNWSSEIKKSDIFTLDYDTSNQGGGYHTKNTFQSTLAIETESYNIHCNIIKKYVEAIWNPIVIIQWEIHVHSRNLLQPNFI